MDLEEPPYLNLIRLQKDDTGGDDPFWRVTFEAATTDMETAELTVGVEAKDPEEALREGRNAMETALKDLKAAASRWGR